MSEVWNHYTDLLILTTAYKFYRWFVNRKNDKTSEKENNSNKPEDLLDTYIYIIGFIILISYAIEILSGMYFANEIIQTFKQFDEQGITSAKIFNGRCSGVYYYKYGCDQKKLAEHLDSSNNIAKALFSGIYYDISYQNVKKDSAFGDFSSPLGDTGYYNSRELSGLYISCSPGHSKELKEHIIKYKWDGPIPVHSEDDCIEAHKYNVGRSTTYL